MGEQAPFRLILASGSPARRELLIRAGYQFDAMPANVEEPGSEGIPDARTYVQHVAWLKAAAVAKRLAADPSIGPAMILAADTVGWLHGRAIGKPADEADARRILRLLAGAEHELWTGVCLWRRPDDVQAAWQEVSRVVMNSMTEADLEAYLTSRLWQGCSGAYAIQEGHDPYVHVVQGSISNVIGLPMETTLRVLHEFAGIQPHGPAGSA
jgi:septum formation protein